MNAWNREGFRYQPYYCEENAWWVLADPRLASVRRWLVFVTNRIRMCPIWHQRAGREGEPVAWDYHVLVVAELQEELHVLDLDSTLGLVVPLHVYVRAAFQPNVGPQVRPWFRVVPADEALSRFASDRRHMRDQDGAWRAPPPPWAPIQGAGAPHDLDRWLDLDESGRGVVCDQRGLVGALR